MASEAELETYTFSADISQLMGVIVKAVYSNKDIFLRELVSNASDALERRRCAGQHSGDPEDYYIRVVPDATEKTLTVEDSGVGMTREELIEALGTVARSKTKAFMEAMVSSSGTDPALIGQFGIGFYSAYVVSERVCVVSRSAVSGDQCIWESAAGGSFTVAPDEEQRHGSVLQGTKVVCFLKEDQHEFLDCDHLKALLTRHSCFVKWPLYVPARRLAHEDAAAPITWERINNISPIWLQRSEEVSCEEYGKIYSWLGHGFERYLAVRHMERSGQHQVPFKALLFCSDHAAGDVFDLIDGRTRGAKIRLFVRGVFVKEFEDLLPKWMCFMTGIVESDDLPLNISREHLQKESSVMRHIAKALAKESFDMLTALSDDSVAFRRFHDKFGQHLKLGVFEDAENRPQIVELLRYHTTLSGSDIVSLREYVLRMDPKQKHILFVTGRSHRHCLQSPLIEGMLRDGREVILMGDPADEFAAQVLKEYQGTELVSAASAFAAGTSDSAPGEPTAALQRLCLRVDELLDEAGRPGRAVLEQSTDDPFPAALREAAEGSPELVLCSGHGLFRELAAKESLGPLERDLVLLIYDLAASLALGRSTEESERRRRLGERLQEMVKQLNVTGRIADEEDMPLLSAETVGPALLGRQAVTSSELSVGSLVRIVGGDRSRRAMVTCVDISAWTVDVLFCSPPDEEQDGVPMASAIPLLSFEEDPDGAKATQLAHEFGENFLVTACRVKEEGNTLFKLRDFEAAAEWYSLIIDAVRHRRIDVGQVVLHPVSGCQLDSSVVQQCSHGVCKFVSGDCCELGAVLPVQGLHTHKPVLEELSAFRQFSEPVVDQIAAAAAGPSLSHVSVQAAAYINRAQCRSALGLEREAAQDLTVALALWRALGQAESCYGDAAVVRGLCKAGYLRARTRLNRGFSHAAAADVKEALLWGPPAAVRKQLEELQGEALAAVIAERHRVREPLAKELAKVTFALRYAAL